MYLRRCYRRKNGKRHGYLALVESYRTARGPRQRVVAYLGDVDEHGRMALPPADGTRAHRSEEHTSELQSLAYLVCRLLLEKKKKKPMSYRVDRVRAERRQDRIGGGRGSDTW